MSVGILGRGWVTPLGSEIASVCEQVREGSHPTPDPLKNPYSGRESPCLRVPAAAIASVSRQPRLRRASIISHLAMTAALAALEDAALATEVEDVDLALIFAASDGGVIYTRKFFAELVDRGTHAGSPLLFPETVYNAPASHVAAKLGITGVTSTIVGDATAGIHAIAMAEDLLQSGECSHCLVVAAQEIDWIVAEAYRMWGIPGADSVVFGEGAAAVLLGAEGKWRIETCAGKNFTTLKNGMSALAGVLASLGRPAALIGSMSGSKFDSTERGAIRDSLGTPNEIHPRTVLGEAFAASTIGQIIVATECCGADGRDAVAVPVLGWNGQCAAASVNAICS